MSSRGLQVGRVYWLVDGRPYGSEHAAKIARAHLARRHVPDMDRVERDAPICARRYVGTVPGRGRQFEEV